ncbi:MAG: CopG family transcriptional regulator [Rickettsiales bacterium]|nr:MAG: CopG family transcriptional regulator [Rickettsiales bacterium]
MLSVRLGQSLENRLNVLSKKTHRPKSFYVKEALEKYISELEDTFIALNRSLSPNRKFYSSKEVLNILQNETP